MYRLVLLVSYGFLPSLYRAYEVEKQVRSLTGVEWRSFIEALRNDLPIVAVILFAFLLSAAFARQKAVAGVLFGIAALLHAILVLDVLIYKEFAQRLTLADVAKHGGYAVSYVLDFDAKHVVAIIVGVFGLIVLNTLAWRLTRKARITARAAILSALALGMVSALAWRTRDTGYVHYRFYQNLVAYNEMVASEFRPYSAAFADDLSNPFDETCQAAPKLAGPVIIYMVESLSSYHSRFFGGLNDWTPQLDRIAAAHLALTSFYANGFTTEDGELALLTAEFPIYPPNSLTAGGSTAFAGYWRVERSLATEFGRNGYATYFLTTSDLAFSSTGDWMRTIGFAHVEGSEAPFYDGMQRFAFDAAPDAALAARVLDVARREDAPLFLFAKTASSHHPYVQPETGERSEEQVIRYVDRQIGALFEGLTAERFFETGHLIIVGDHRAMRPLTPAEVATFGFERALAHVPAVVIGPDLAPRPRRIAAPHGQADIANSLLGLASGRICKSALRGAIWGGGAASPDYILHRRGDLRNQISVFSDERQDNVVLDGDETRFAGDAFSKEEQADLLEFINRSRVRAEK